MPRSGWIATGTVLGALLVTQGPQFGIVLLALVSASVLLASMAVTRLMPGPGARTLTQRAPLMLALLALGTLLIAARALLAAPEPAGRQGPLPGGNGPWIGVVESIGAPRAGQQPAVVALETPPDLRVASTLPVFPLVVPGDRVVLQGALRAPPTDDPYGEYLARIGVQATIRASRLEVETTQGSLGRTLEGLRRGADSALQRAVPEPEAGLAAGILIGLRDRVDRDLSAAFTAVGATHVVAISGWNIAIVATTLAALAGRLARRRRALLTAIAIVAYVAFVGPSPSVVRAAGMAGVVMLARELGRPSRAAAAIGWAVVALLVVDPHLVEDVGFQLSALATVGLIAWGTPFSDRLAGPSPGRARAWLAESLGVSLAAQLATLPIVVLAFGRLSIVSPVVNLGVVPLVAPAMGAGVVALGGGLLSMAGLPAGIATVLGLPAWLLLALMVGVVRAGASLPFASVQIDEPWNVAIAACIGIGILGVMAWARRITRARPGGRGVPSRTSQVPHVVARKPPSWWQTRGGRWLAGGLAASMIALSVVVVHRPSGVPSVTVLDVGQGDAILVEGGRGGRLLVDGGPDPGRLLIALDEHLPPWDRRIDVVILSHPHEDHAAGLAALMDRYSVARVLEPGMFGPGPGYAALNAELISFGIARGTLSTGDRLSVDEFRFRVLWPDAGAVPEQPPDTGTAINNVSIVLLGEVDGHRLLLAGDIEDGIDPLIVARGLPVVDFLKVAHHGSRTATTQALLDAVRPSIAAISAGRGNPYGHPAPSTVARLEHAGARVFRTDTDGSVAVNLGPGLLRVRSSGPRAIAATPSVSLAVASASRALAATALAATQALLGGVWSGSRPVGGLAVLCDIPLPPLGIVAISVPSPPPPETPPETLGTDSNDLRSVATIGRFVPRIAPVPLSDEQGGLGYDAARDPRTPDRSLPAAFEVVPLGPENRRAWVGRARMALKRPSRIHRCRSPGRG